MAFPNPIVVGEQLFVSGIHSENYKEGATGWRIAKDGSAQFSSVIIGDPSFPPGSIDGDTIKNGTVNSDQLANGAVDDSKISSVDGSKLSNGSVDNSKISGVDGSKIDGNINSGQLTPIQPDKLIVQPDNLIGDPWVDNADYWQGLSAGAGSELQSTDMTLPGHNYSTKLVCNSGSNYTAYPKPQLVPEAPYGVPAVAGEAYQFVCWVYCDEDTDYANARVSFRAYFRKDDGTLYNGVATDYSAGTFPTKQWIKLVGIVTGPAGTFAACPRLTIYGANAGEVFYVAGQSLFHAIDVSRILDGAVTGIKIADGAITAPKIAANSITSDQIVAGSIVADSLDLDTLNGKTITGAIIQTETDVPGRRLVIGRNLSGGADSSNIAFYNDADTSYPGVIGPYTTNNNNPALAIVSPKTADKTNTAEIDLVTDSDAVNLWGSGGLNLVDGFLHIQQNPYGTLEGDGGAPQSIAANQWVNIGYMQWTGSGQYMSWDGVNLSLPYGGRYHFDISIGASSSNQGDTIGVRLRQVRDGSTSDIAQFDSVTVTAGYVSLDIHRTIDVSADDKYYLQVYVHDHPVSINQDSPAQVYWDIQRQISS